MIKKVLIDFTVFGVVCATPIPQDPNEEVEIVEPVNTNVGGFGGFGPRVRVFFISNADDDFEEKGGNNNRGFWDILKSILRDRYNTNLGNDQKETVKDESENVDDSKEHETSIDDSVIG
eukprot:GFUD01134612.1.p2 GENE.GFUD01134612.1~~GFUD01134612.1.p2  ORF type:complete len:119 (-),score=34.64 GFUD01134612.1:14-370(-)